jgi:hypothetical protein
MQNTQTMKHSLRHTIVACAVVALAIGCTTIKTRQEMLSKAGFKIVPATTTQQQAHLKTLSTDRVTMAVRNGTNYFVYPDVKSEVLYVGNYAQYKKYEKLRFQNEQAEAQGNDAEWTDRAVDLSDWGAYGAWDQ